MLSFFSKSGDFLEDIIELPKRTSDFPEKISDISEKTRHFSEEIRHISYNTSQLVVMKRYLLKYCSPILIILSLFFASCADDEHETLDNLIAALAEVSTNSDGRIVSLDLDNGVSYKVTNTISKLTPDSAYRVSLLYVLGPDKRATMYNLHSVISPKAKDLKGAPNPHTNPLDLVSIWPTKKYLNLTVDYQSGDENHLWGFAQTGLDLFADGHQVLNLELVHSQNGDELYYTRRRILSCPIYPFADLLTTGRDSIRFTLNTFKGVRSYTFAAP